MPRVTWLFLLVLQCCGCWCNGFILAKNPDWTLKAIEGLERAVDFFDNNYEDIILDGVFGLRVAEGQLDAALEHVRFGAANPTVQDLIPRVTSLRQRIRQVADKCMPALEKLNPDYFNWFYDAINRPYAVPYIPRHVVPSELLGNETANYTEAAGDQCFGELMGAQSSNYEKSEKCVVSDGCIDMMTARWRKDYAITHQLLYFMEAQHSGCTREVEAVLGEGSVPAFEQHLCNQIYTETKYNVVNNLKYFYSQDLFFEQCMVCGMLGFEDFLKAPWLRRVLAWQDPVTGCYTNQRYDQLRAQRWTPTLRKLLYERKLEDGCLSHKSGLATGLLGLYVRYLVEHGGNFQ